MTLDASSSLKWLSPLSPWCSEASPSMLSSFGLLLDALYWQKSWNKRKDYVKPTRSTVIVHTHHLPSIWLTWPTETSYLPRVHFPMTSLFSKFHSSWTSTRLKFTLLGLFPCLEFIPLGLSHLPKIHSFRTFPLPRVYSFRTFTPNYLTSIFFYDLLQLSTNYQAFSLLCSDWTLHLIA